MVSPSTIPQDLAHLSTEELIAEVERRAYERGHRDGYAGGYNKKFDAEYNRGLDTGEKVGYRRGYDAGRQYSHRQRKNDALRNKGVREVRDQLLSVRASIDAMLDLHGLGAYTSPGIYRASEN